MRTGPFSNKKVVELLNAYYVPVYISNEDFRGKGGAPAEERKELHRIFQEGHKAKLSVGTVHAYILSPEGRTVDSLHVAEAAKVERFIAMLEANARKFEVPAGKPVVKPVPQSTVAEKAPEGSLVLHLVARSISGGGWGGVPGENWIVYAREEVGKFLPSGKAAVGTTWEIDKRAATKLLTHFYPETENNDVSKNRIDEISLKATVVSIDRGTVTARLEGRLKMKHPFYHKDEDRFVNATMVGFIEFDSGNRSVKSFRLVTDKATYGTGAFAVAVRSVD